MKRHPLSVLLLQVTSDDIEEMYERYDSGMADHTTANAVSIALGRELKSGWIPRIVSALRHRACRLEIGEETFPLGSEVCEWLESTGRGVVVFPTVFAMVLPRDVLRIDEPVADFVEKPIAA